MTRTRIGALGLLAAAALLACEDNPFITGSFAVDGRWTGATLAGAGRDTVRFHFDLELEQDRSVIRGVGRIHTARDTFQVRVDGRWSYPSVELVMRAPDVASLSFAGAFDVDTVPRPAPDSLRDVVTRSDSIMGTLAGSGLDRVRLELGRAP